MAINPAVESFVEAWITAEPYVSDEAAEVLEKIAKLQESIEWSQMSWTESPEPDLVPVEVHDDGFGLKVQKQHDDLRAEAKKLLRPYAQLKAKA